MNQDMNLFFYSTKCKTCGVFMQISQKNNILKFFKLICIDGQERSFQDKGLKKVPTIVIKSMGKPIEGNDCLAWLESTLKLRSGQINDKTNDQYLPEVGINNTNGMIGSRSNLNTHNNTHTQNANANTNTNPNPNPNNQFEVPKTNILKRTNLLYFSYIRENLREICHNFKKEIKEGQKAQKINLHN
jgi:hypothetical protein